jgi:hypothetical protein
MTEIQELRKELTKIIQNHVIPMRDKLDLLLNKEAVKICPFAINDTITLENGKQGIVTEIKYLSLDYEFATDSENEMFDFLPKMDEIEYKYAYSVDDKTFSITWTISGFRLNKDGEIGKVKFVGINPINYIINKEEMKISRKQMQNYMTQDNFLQFDKIE